MSGKHHACSFGRICSSPTKECPMNALFARNSSRNWFRICFFSMALLLPAALVAQGYFGTVSGVLTDTSGAVVQGAKVTLTDEQKGFTFNTTSDNEGRYLFVSMPPGLYS